MRGVLLPIFFILLAVSIWTPQISFGALPKEMAGSILSPGEINTDLIDLEVKYDLALAKEDYESVSKHLREIGLYYFNSNQIKLAEGFIWRSKIVAEKNNLLQQDLYSCALLSKLSMQLGDSKAAMEFEEEYLEILARISSNEKSVQEKVPNSESPFTENPSPTNEVVQGNIENSFPVSVIIWSLSLLIVLLIWFIAKDSFKATSAKSRSNIFENTHSQSVGLNERSASIAYMERENNLGSEEKVSHSSQVPVQGPVLADIDINEESINLPDDSDSKIFTPREIIVQNKPEVRTMPKVDKPNFHIPVDEISNSSRPITSEDIIKARGSKYYEKANIPELPLWVSGLEHHIKSINSFRGIRFDFNYSGDFADVNESVYVIITDFIKSFTDELVDSENVKKVSVLLVKTDAGLVLQAVISPTDTSLPVLTSEVINFYEREFVNNPICKLRFSTNSIGDLKMVLKNVDMERIFQS